MAKSSERFEPLRRDTDALARRLDMPLALIIRSLSRHMCVEASAGRLEDTYPIGAESRKNVHEDGTRPLYYERMIDCDAPLHVRDSRQETEWTGNEDEVEFGLNNYLGYPVHTPDGTPYGTVYVLDSRPRGCSVEERALLEELRCKVEMLLTETVS